MGHTMTFIEISIGGWILLVFLASLVTLVYMTVEYVKSKKTDCLSQNFCRQFPMLLYVGEFDKEDDNGVPNKIMVGINRITRTLELTRGSPNYNEVELNDTKVFPEDRTVTDQDEVPTVNHTIVYSTPVPVEDAVVQYVSTFKNESMVKKFDPTAVPTKSDFDQSDDSWKIIESELYFARDTEGKGEASLLLTQKVQKTGKIFEKKFVKLRFVDMKFLSQWISGSMFKMLKRK